jgi:toxin co-regulated pilus biosynthesis protein B
MVSKMSATSNNKGFTLLEMIIVMGIMGIILATFTVYKRKQIEAIARENLTNIIVSEIYGVLKFANEDYIYVDEDKDGEADAGTLENPLYNKNYVISGDQKNKTYSQRTSNVKITDTLNTDYYMQWDNSQSRGYFTSKACGSPAGRTADATFFKEYILCNQPRGSADRNLVLERVDLVGDDITHTINRIDFIVAYNPGHSEKKDIDKFSIENFSSAFSESFSHYGLVYSHGEMIYRSSAKSSTAENYGKGWNLLKLNGASPTDNAVPFGSLGTYIQDIPNNIEQLGIRFSFEAGVGKYLKADGSVGAKKLCWNYKENLMAHCLETENGSGRNQDEGVMHLTAKNANNQIVTGTLMANVIFEGEAFDPEKGNVVALMTSPVVSYQSFGNKKDTGTNDVIVNDPDNYNKKVTDEPGHIKLPVQTCPQAPPDPADPQKVPRQLYPRMAAAISSIAADVGKLETSEGENEDGGDFTDFSNSENNRRTTTGVLDHLSGVAVQVNFINDDANGDYWVISATSGVFDNVTGQGVSVINPSSLSVVLTSWCSSIKQPELNDSIPMPPN